MPSVGQDKALDWPQDRLAAWGVRKGQGLWPGPGRQRQLCKETRGPPVSGQGRSCSPFLSPFLSLTGRLVALLLGDEETQLSAATALDGMRASIVPASASGANVTPKEDGDCDLRTGIVTRGSSPALPSSTCSPPTFCFSLALWRLCLRDRWGLPCPLLISFLI